MRLPCNILLVKMMQMSPERRSNIGGRPRWGCDGDERLCSDCWHASSYLLPNDIYTAERSMLVSCSFCAGGRAISREGSEMQCTCLTTPKRASHSQILRAPTHHDSGWAAGSALARTLIKVSTSDDYTPESDLNHVGVFWACEFNSFMVPEV